MRADHLRAFGKYASIDAAGNDYEAMNRARWMQTLKDLPIVVGASAAGYGVGKTVMDELARRSAGPVVTQGAKYAPLIGQLIGTGVGYAAGRMRQTMSERRDLADAMARARGEAKTAEDKKRAILITGNPKYIEGNPQAAKFYSKVEKVLSQAGYDVVRNAGEPYTQPDEADLWVGHSRGADRLRFAGPGTKTVALGVSDGLAHPKDSAAQGGAPNKYHYKLTSSMVEALRDRRPRGST